MDTNEINFNDLWQKRTVSTPDIQIILSKAKQYKTAQRNRTLKANLLLLATSLFILLVWVYFKPQYLTTKLGITLIIVAILSFVFLNAKAYMAFKKESETMSIHEQLKALINWKEKQKFIQTTVLNGYFIVLSLGLALYMFEYTSKMEVVWGIVAYAVTSVWILLNWFYFRPKQIRKYQRELDEILEKLESVNRQFKE